MHDGLCFNYHFKWVDMFQHRSPLTNLFSLEEVWPLPKLYCTNIDEYAEKWDFLQNGSMIPDASRDMGAFCSSSIFFSPHLRRQSFILLFFYSVFGQKVVDRSTSLCGGGIKSKRPRLNGESGGALVKVFMESQA